jgi:hypothetical protein
MKNRGGGFVTFALRCPRHRWDTVQCTIDPCCLSSSLPTEAVLMNVDSICGYSIDVRGLCGIDRFKVAQSGGLQVKLNVRVL